MWHLRLHDGSVNRFSSLTELAESINTQSEKKFRFAPSEYGEYFLFFKILNHRRQ